MATRQLAPIDPLGNALKAFNQRVKKAISRLEDEYKTSPEDRELLDTSTDSSVKRYRSARLRYAQAVADGQKSPSKASVELSRFDAIRAISTPK